MRRSIFSAMATVLGLILFLTLSPAATAAEITIQPKAISLDSVSNGSGSVSVHTDIPYNSGTEWEVRLVEPNLTGWAKSDDCGRLVGKFSLGGLEAYLRTLDLGNGKVERSVTLTFTATAVETNASGTGTVIVTRAK